jgi:hypothetical protein
VDVQHVQPQPVIAPGDADYDQARTVFIGGIDRWPAVIVSVADETNMARETGPLKLISYN